MSKKIISAVLALVFVMSLFTVSAFAVGDTAVEKDGSTYKQEWSLSQPENNGANGEYKVYVTLKADYTVGAIQFVAAPEKGKATLTGVELNSAVFTTAYNAQVSYNAVTGKVLIIPKPTSPSADGINNLGDGKVIATLTYELEEGATSSKIEIDNQPKTAKDPDGTLVAARLHEGTLTTATMYYGQNVTVGDSITIGAAAAECELVVKDGTYGVIDENRMCVYGIDVLDACQTLGDVFDVTNGGSFDVTPSAADAEEGTGAILVAKDAGGNVIGEYTVVIHGDVNGDGSSDALDADILCQYEGGIINDFSEFGISDDIAYIAGDINADEGADALDADVLCQYEGGIIDELFDITTLPQEIFALGA